MMNLVRMFNFYCKLKKRTRKVFINLLLTDYGRIFEIDQCKEYKKEHSFTGE